jgi:hypothetical protein
VNKKTVPNLTHQAETSAESISGGMTQGEAMQRLIALQARDRAAGLPMAPMAVAPWPWPDRPETSHERLKRRHPGLTDETIDELTDLHGG